MVSPGPVPTPPLLPAALVYGTVSWTVVGIAEDTLVDFNPEPDPELIQGWATFTAAPTSIQKTSPNPVTVLPRPQRYQILNGHLVDKENRLEISLVGNDSPGTNPRGWSYHVDWELTDGYTFGSFDFYLAGDEHKDLTDEQPLDSSTPGVIITKGEAATLEIGSVTTLMPGQAATVENVGDEFNAELNFGIPRGATGLAATVGVGTTETLVPGSMAYAHNAGTASAAVLEFGIPRGQQGIQGERGFAATIEIGGTATLEPGEDAEVENVGDENAAVFDFMIPRGEKGDAATVDVGTTVTLPPGEAASAINSGTLYAALLDFGIPEGLKGDPGDKGEQGDPGPIGAGAPPATATELGSIKLAGALGGTAEAPTVPGLDTRVSTAVVGVAGGVASLDNAGKIPASQIPAIAIAEYLGTAADQAAMLALVGDRGDWITRTDRNSDWQLIADDETQLSSWREMTYPNAPVSSVAGRTGAVLIGSGDVTDSTAVGRSVLTAGDPAAARGVIGAGTSSLGLGTTSTTAKAGDWKPAIADISNATDFGKAILATSDPAVARGAIGAVGSTTIASLQVLTQAAYNALGSKVATTLYVIQG